MMSFPSVLLAWGKTVYCIVCTSVPSEPRKRLFLDLASRTLDVSGNLYGEHRHHIDSRVLTPRSRRFVKSQW